MKIERLPISQLKAAPYNPRITLKPGDAAWKKLERSLDEFNLVQPIVWNQRTGHIVSGHQRLEVLKHHEETEVECVIVDLTLEREKALNVTLNNASVGSDWQADQLVDLLSELQELPDFDVTLTGFDDQQLQDMLLAPHWSPEDEVDGEGSGEEGIAQAILEIPHAHWEAAEQALNALLAKAPEVRLHLKNVPQK